MLAELEDVLPNKKKIKAIEFDKQDEEVLIQIIDYLEDDGSYLSDGLKKILSKMKELQREVKS